MWWIESKAYCGGECFAGRSIKKTQNQINSEFEKEQKERKIKLQREQLILQFISLYRYFSAIYEYPTRAKGFPRVFCLFLFQQQN